MINCNNLVAELVGIPYQELGSSTSGCDCYGLVKLFYRRAFYLILPEKNYEIDDYLGLNELIKAELKNNNRGYKWEQQTRPRWGDVVLIRLKGELSHCGIVVDGGNFLHCLKNTNSCLESLSSPVWSKRTAGFYRWKI